MSRAPRTAPEDDPLSGHGPPSYGLPEGVPESAIPPAGWYEDPLSGPHRRWWDGTRWTASLEGAAEAWRPLGGALAVAAVLIAGAAIAGIPVLSAYVAEAHADSRMVVGSPGFHDALAAFGSASDRIESAFRLAVLAQVVAGVAFLVWFHRAHRDAADIRGGVRFPRWTVWGWIVPFVSLYRPKQMVNDVWMAGDPRLDLETSPTGIDASVQVWWVAWLLWALFAALVPIMGTIGPPGILADRLLAVQFGCVLVAGAAAIVWMVRATARLNARQRVRAARPPALRVPAQ